MHITAARLVPVQVHLVNVPPENPSGLIKDGDTAVTASLKNCQRFFQGGRFRQGGQLVFGFNQLAKNHYTNFSCFVLSALIIIPYLGKI